MFALRLISLMERLFLIVTCMVAWAVPGGGHLLLRRYQKGFIFLVALTLMFVVGLVLDGRLFPFTTSQPLVVLAAAANLGMGLLYFVAWAAGMGDGVVSAVTYEYGNTFLIVAGLLNLLVVLDAFDIALGRK